MGVTVALGEIVQAMTVLQDTPAITSWALLSVTTAALIMLHVINLLGSITLEPLVTTHVMGRILVTGLTTATQVTTLVMDTTAVLIPMVSEFCLSG